MTESQAIKIARLEENMGSVAEKVDKLDVKIDSLIEKVEYATAIKSELGEVTSKLLYMEAKLVKMERARWVQNSLSALLASVLTFLILFFLTNVGKP